MRPQSNPPQRLQELLDLLVDEQIGEADFAELQGLLLGDDAMLRYYSEFMELHAGLQKGRLLLIRGEPRRAGSTASHLPMDESPAGAASSTGGSARHPARAASGWMAHPGRVAAAAVAVAMALTYPVASRLRTADRGRDPGPSSGVVARVLSCEDVTWSGTMPTPPSEGTPLRVGQALSLSGGTIGLLFGVDASVRLEGPAEAELRSATRLRVSRGKVTVRVGPMSKGFAVEAPGAEVIDLGTEFGMEIDRGGRTDVVVFQGAVDLSYGMGADRGQTRLTRGEALRLAPGGDLSRIVSIERLPHFGRWSTGAATSEDAVIRQVADNIRGLGSAKFYQVIPRGLEEDAEAYVDRLYQWNGLNGAGLPAFLRLADYVMPFNDDKRSREILVTLELSRPATLYVFYDDRAKVPPWLDDQFVDTGYDIGLDEGASDPEFRPNDLGAGQGSLPTQAKLIGKGPGNSVDYVFSVWKREVDRAGTVTLGSMVDATRVGKVMYGIAAVGKDGE